MNTSGFAIKLTSGEFAGKSGKKYDGPVTVDLIQARMFKTKAMAEKTLARMQKDGGYGHKFRGAQIILVRVSLELGDDEPRPDTAHGLNPDIIGLPLGSIIGCCKSIGAHPDLVTPEHLKEIKRISSLLRSLHKKVVG